MAKISASQLAAQEEYFKANNIHVYKEKKAKYIVPQEKGVKVHISLLGLTDLKDFAIYMEGINKAPILIYMTDKEIVTKLLDHYDMVLISILDREDVLEYLTKENCQYGICSCSRMKFGVKITDSWFVTQWCDPNDTSNRYWFETPNDANPDRLRMIKAIAKRVNRLQEILNSMQ